MWVDFRMDSNLGMKGFLKNTNSVREFSLEKCALSFLREYHSNEYYCNPSYPFRNINNEMLTRGGALLSRNDFETLFRYIEEHRQFFKNENEDFISLPGMYVEITCQNKSFKTSPRISLDLRNSCNMEIHFITKTDISNWRKYRDLLGKTG